MRLLSRIFLTNLSLHADCAERVAMIETFLALMQDEKKVKEDDRVLILQALFRRSAPPPGPDETAPSHLINQLLKQIDRTPGR